MQDKKPSKPSKSRSAYFDAFEARAVEPAPERPQFDVGGIPDAIALAVGIAPGTLPSPATGHSPAAPSKRLGDSWSALLTEAEWATIEPICKRWKQNNVSKRSHRDTIVASLFLARSGLGWSYAPSELAGENGQAALRQRAICGAVSRESRWEALLDAAETAGSWRPTTLALLRSIVHWGKRVRERILHERERVRRAATGAFGAS